MSEFDRIIGYEEEKLEMMRYADALKNPEKYRNLGATTPTGVFLFGKPGVGKTLMAECFIAESGCKAFTIRKDRPKDDLMNTIRETYEKARVSAPAIVFLDDIDKFANEDLPFSNAEEYVTVQACIDECRGVRVFSLATANSKDDLPESLLRAGRFDKTIELIEPKEKDSISILKHYLSQRELLDDVDPEVIARILYGHSCAVLESVINEAGIYAGFEGHEKISQKDLIRACLRELYEAPEYHGDADPELLRSYAIHEAGHAVVAEVLEPGSVALAAICKRAGSSNGIVNVTRPGEFNLTMDLQKNKMMCGLGGKAATEVILGVTDLGCELDLKKVKWSLNRLVAERGAYGFEALNKASNSSQAHQERVESIISSEMEHMYNKAKRIILENRDLFDAIVDALIEKRSITYKDIERIKAGLNQNKTNNAA